MIALTNNEWLQDSDVGSLGDEGPNGQGPGKPGRKKNPKYAFCCRVYADVIMLTLAFS